MTRAGLALLALAGYCVATAVAATWVSFSFTGISGPALTFVTFALAQIVYSVRAGGDVRKIMRFAFDNRADVAVLNVLTLSSWLFMFMALQRIEASVESAIYQGAVAITGFLLASLVTGDRFSQAARFGVFTAAGALVALALVRLASHDGTPTSHTQVPLGVGLALVAGVTGGFYIHRSSRLHRRTGATTMTVLCVRFLLLLVVTGALGGSEVTRLSRTDPVVILRLLALSVVFVVVPTFLLQFAIANLASARVSVATPLVPLIALGSEYAVHPWGSVLPPLIVVAASITLVATNWVLARDYRVPAQPSLVNVGAKK